MHLQITIAAPSNISESAAGTDAAQREMGDRRKIERMQAKAQKAAK